MKKVYLFVAFLVFSQIGYSQNADIFDLARTGSAEQAEKLLNQDQKLVNTTNTDGYTPLILACYRSNNAVAKLLLQKGANIDAISGMGTALMASVVKGNLEMAKHLIERKANPNLSDANGTTALLYSVMFKKHELASLLMKSGADANHKDNRGQSALDYAILSNDDKLIEILKTKKL
ncbi:ankyrin repeat domain-containing protein [Flavobacterium sp.]|uniref:ankyrin repeat domain-containing protein n=1 Tax=Flavobacterium sp. TaxID=239 RepID=UPI001223395E|nr:ankyrin repeat domain-containing protein [Flavobacterium sp.]RZJ73936.1 MAG: ankyrin repeat domain-containing protein [Flavobacterium sp.]